MNISASTHRIARVLVVAGSDSGAGAGIQADLKTAAALGAYATTAITAVTAQNTLGVRASTTLDPAMVEAQMRAVLEDIGADAIKTGMLGSGPVATRVAAVLAGIARDIPLVVDPVMIAKGGASLVDDAGRASMLRDLLPLATLVTPNTDEASALTGCPIASERDMRLAAERLITLGARAVLVKGGHLPGDEVIDVLCDRSGATHRFASPRIQSRSTHGTGCTLATAIAVGLAQDLDLLAAIERARAFVRAAIATAFPLGAGHGPMNHGVDFKLR